MICGMSNVQSRNQMQRQPVTGGEEHEADMRTSKTLPNGEAPKLSTEASSPVLPSGRLGSFTSAIAASCATARGWADPVEMRAR